MKTEPAPEDWLPRTPDDPPGLDPVEYRWDRTNACCETCPLWDRDASNPRHLCPRAASSLRAQPGLDFTFLACYGPNRPDGREAKYFKRRLYGNEED